MATTRACGWSLRGAAARIYLRFKMVAAVGFPTDYDYKMLVSSHK
jgi:hypothetical protein